MVYIKEEVKICPECGRGFQNDEAFKTHYVRKHMTAFDEAQRVLDEVLLKRGDSHANGEGAGRTEGGLQEILSKFREGG